VRALDRLGSPALMPLWKAVHDRMSSGKQVSRVKFGPLDEEQRSAVADLLGAERLPGEYTTVSVASLDELLFAAVGADAREVVTSLLGPLDDRAARRAAAADERSGLWEWLAGHPVVATQPALREWVDAVRRAGLIGGSAERTRNELDRALRVFGALPATGVPLPVLAEDVLGDPHGLDEGTRCAGLVLRALAVLHAVELPRNLDGRDSAGGQLVSKLVRTCHRSVEVVGGSTASSTLAPAGPVKHHPDRLVTPRCGPRSYYGRAMPGPPQRQRSSIPCR
jgi:hypothetical protein